MTGDERGTALIEALLTLTVLASVLGSGLLLMYLSLARSWVSHTAYEAAVCLATDAEIGRCEREARTALAVLPIGRFAIQRFERVPAHSTSRTPSRGPSHTRVAIDYRVGDVAVIKRSELLQLPLRTAGDPHAR